MKKAFILFVMFGLVSCIAQTRPPRLTDWDGSSQDSWQVGKNGGKLKFDNDSLNYYIKYKVGASWDSTGLIGSKNPRGNNVWQDIVGRKWFKTILQSDTLYTKHLKLIDGATDIATMGSGEIRISNGSYPNYISWILYYGQNGLGGRSLDSLAHLRYMRTSGEAKYLTGLRPSAPTDTGKALFFGPGGVWSLRTIAASHAAVTETITGIDLTGQALSLTAGYSIPQDTSIANWRTAYAMRHSHSNKTKLDSITVAATRINSIPSSYVGLSGNNEWTGHSRFVKALLTVDTTGAYFNSYTATSGADIKGLTSYVYTSSNPTANKIYGGYFRALGSGTSGGSFSYGIYAEAAGSNTNYAGYFVGDVYITGTITGALSGNASTVTNGVYTSGSYSNPSWLASLAETKISFTDVTTGNASTSNHGYLPKLNNSATQFLNGQGAWATPASAVDTSKSYNWVGRHRFISSLLTADTTGAYFNAYTATSGADIKGLTSYVYTSSNPTANKIYGGFFSALGSGTSGGSKSYGIYSVATGSNDNYAGYFNAPSGYAGYFDNGLVYIKDNLQVGSAKFIVSTTGTITKVNDLLASSYTDYFIMSDGTSYTPTNLFGRANTWTAANEFQADLKFTDDLINVWETATVSGDTLYTTGKTSMTTDYDGDIRVIAGGVDGKEILLMSTGAITSMTETGNIVNLPSGYLGFNQYGTARFKYYASAGKWVCIGVENN